MMHKLRKSGSPSFSPDSRILATSGSASLLLFDVESKGLIRQFKGLPHLMFAAISPLGDRIAVKSTTGRIAVFDLEGDLIVDCKNQKEGEGCKLLWTSDGKELIDGAWQNLITRRSAESGEILAQAPAHKVGQICLVGDRLVTKQTIPGNHPRGFVEERDASSLEPSGEPIFFKEYCVSAGVSPSGAYIWSHAGKPVPTLFLHDERLSVLKEQQFDYLGSGGAIAFHPQECEMTLVNQKDTISRFSLPDLEIIESYEVKYPSEAAYSPDGGWLALGGWSSGLLVSLR